MFGVFIQIRMHLQSLLKIALMEICQQVFFMNNIRYFHFNPFDILFLFYLMDLMGIWVNWVSYMFVFPFKNDLKVKREK